MSTLYRQDELDDMMYEKSKKERERIRDEQRKTMKKVKIECDLAMKERIKIVFAEETERCFFGPGYAWCGDYMTTDGPNCARCIEDNVEWILDE